VIDLLGNIDRGNCVFGKRNLAANAPDGVKTVESTCILTVVIGHGDSQPGKSAV